MGNAHIENSNSGFVEEGKYRDKPARVFITRRTAKDDLFEVQRLLNKLGHEAGDVDGIMGPATWKAITAFQEARNVEKNGKVDNDLINSLYLAAGEKRPPNGRLMVRKYYRNVFEAGVEIGEPETPLGSHLITSSSFDADAGKVQWVSLSLLDRVHRPLHLRTENDLDTTTQRRSVFGALSRISIDKRVSEQVSRLLSPGSSIAISDNGLSIETGAKGTDFIVLSKPDKDKLASAN